MSEHHIFTVAEINAAMERVVQGGHSVFAPSASKMWLNCAGALIPNLFAPDDSGEDAAYGTVGHMVGEVWLKTGKKPYHLLNKTYWVDGAGYGFFIGVDEVMLDHVERYVKWCRRLEGQHFVETRVDFSKLTPIPNQGGTADHVACAYQVMVITDLKMGKGVWVYAEKNTQAMLYALGFFFAWDWLYDFQWIIIRIAQPRLDNFDTWEITREELLEFAKEVKVKAAAAWVQNAPRTPSPEACQWCRIKATCTAKAKVVFDMIGGDMTTEGKPVDFKKMTMFKKELATEEDPALAKIGTLNTVELEKLMTWRGTVERFFKEVYLELMRRAEDGSKLTLLKQVEGRSRRAWHNPKVAMRKLMQLGLQADDLISEDIASPAAVEELLRKIGYKTKDLPDLLEGLVYKPPGKTTLAPIQDKRPAFLEGRDGGAFDD
jgi:hypothetical protein